MNQAKRLFRYILWAVASALLAWVVKTLFQRAAVNSGANVDRPIRPTPAAQRTKALFRDPVCGTYVAEDLAHLLTQGGENLHFCSRDCMEHYQRDLRVRDGRSTNRLAAGA